MRRLDVTKNTALKNLYCKEIDLSTLDVTKNTALQRLDCSGNKLSSLDVSINTALLSLNCANNKLTGLDLANNTALEELVCSNQTIELDVTHNTALKKLSCVACQLTTLDVTHNTALQDLHCNNNLLTELDVTKNTALTELYCNNNQLTELDLTKNIQLQELGCGGNQLTTLNLTKNTALKKLYCGSNLLTELDVTINTALEVLNCSTNQLTKLDVTGCTELKELNIGNNQLRALDLSTQTNLTELYGNEGQDYAFSDVMILSNSELGIPYPEAVDPSRIIYMNAGGRTEFSDDNINGTNYHYVQNRSIQIMSYILWNSLTCSYEYDMRCATLKFANKKLYVRIKPIPYVACGEDNRGEGNFPDANFRTLMQSAEYDQDGDGTLSKEELTSIVELSVPNMDITTMQGIEYMKYLQMLDCSGNQLDEVSDLPLVITTEGYGSRTYNPELQNLDCSGNHLNAIDVSRSAKLETLDCSDNALEGTFSVANCNTLTTLNCASNQISELTLPTTKTTLQTLNCNTNQLTALSTINEYTGLTSLDCGNNQIPELDLDGNSQLTNLNCGTNLLTELDLSNNTGLTVLDCSTNNLTALDLSANEALTQLNYHNQTRSIEAESGQAHVGHDEQGNVLLDKFYYMRLDNNLTGENEEPIWQHMTETNYGQQTSTFLPDRASWTSGGIVINGTGTGSNRVASVDDVHPKNVVGQILLLTDVTEVPKEDPGEMAGKAYGAVKYKYNVNNDDIDPDGTKGDFTLNWTASDDIGTVTEVTGMSATRQPVTVTYHNLAGQVRDTPWQGVNIVVKRHSDGTTTTSKLVQ